MLLNSVLNEAVLEPTLARYSQSARAPGLLASLVLACRAEPRPLCVNDNLYRSRSSTRYLSMRAKSLIVMM